MRLSPPAHPSWFIAMFPTADDLHIEIHAVERDFASGGFDFAPLGRVLVENGIGVVDVNVDSAVACIFGHGGEASAWPADGHVAHRERGLVADTLRDHFVVAPACA